MLKGSLLLGAGTAVGGSVALTSPARAAAEGDGAGLAPPSSRLRAGEAGPVEVQPVAAPGEEKLHVREPGSDFMVDILRALKIDYVAAMPGSSFRGLQESVVNYGKNSKPKLIVCAHEETSAAICHGYAKVAGKPMACMVHSNVGLQHASMAIYNAWCDRVPMIVIAGNVLDATKRRPGVEWLHTAQDVAAQVRDFVKWDDMPLSLPHYAESFVRAYSISMTPPQEPVLIVCDAELQEEHMEHRAELKIPRLAAVAPAMGDTASVEAAARLLVNAKNPLIVADRAVRTPDGLPLMVRLAELLNAPVIDQMGRMNFPSNHYLNQTFLQTTLVRDADVILGLELGDVYGLTNAVADLIDKVSRRTIGVDTKVISISTGYGYMKSNQQDFQRYFAADITMAADAEATLPSLIAAIERQITPAQRQVISGRTEKLKQDFKDMREAAVYDAAHGWDASPVSTARLSQELWAQIKSEKWALVSDTDFINRWPQRLWDITETYQYIGAGGGYGVGYGAPAAVGAALAHAEAGRLTVCVQADGDLMCAPQVFWTLAHHSIPMLMLMHNNRAWHQETMHLQRMANRRDRDPTTWGTGTLINEPNIDYAGMARSMGVWAEGPISDPDKLAASITRALAVVKAGKPALIDVITQPR